MPEFGLPLENEFDFSIDSSGVMLPLGGVNAKGGVNILQDECQRKQLEA